MYQNCSHGWDAIGVDVYHAVCSRFDSLYPVRVRLRIQSDQDIINHFGKWMIAKGIIRFQFEPRLAIRIAERKFYCKWYDTSRASLATSRCDCRMTSSLVSHVSQKLLVSR